MYCPNCKQEHDGKFCPECGTKLIEKPAKAGHINASFGDAAAISGGLHLSDSHNTQNVDNSVHNISTTTNNITQVTAQKTDLEVLQEKKILYMNACKRAYEDNVLEQSEKMELDRYRLEIGLDEATADHILDQVRQLVMRNAQKSELTGLAKIKLHQLTEALKKNEIQALIQQIDSFEALAGKFLNEELQYKYYLVLSALRHEKCIEKYENSKVDNYWRSFWTYFAYLKANKPDKASEIVFSLSDKFPNYPEDNATLLATAGAYIKNGIAEAKEYLTAVGGDYTPALQRFVESLYLLLDPETAKEMGAVEKGCAFYLINFFQNEHGGQTRGRVGGSINSNAALSPTSSADTSHETIVQKWQRMTLEGYKMILEVQEDDDFASIMNMLIPPAIAQIPLAIALTAAGFHNFGHKDEAVKWASKLMALDPNNEDPDVMLGKAAIYEEGFGGYSKNVDYAIAFYRASASKGNMDALGFIADLYYEGEDVERNPQQALSWAKKAYDAKNPFGLFIYGRAYYEGMGLPKDTITGKRLIREAASMEGVFSVGVVEAQLYSKNHIK